MRVECCSCIYLVPTVVRERCSKKGCFTNISKQDTTGSSIYLCQHFQQYLRKRLMIPQSYGDSLGFAKGSTTSAFMKLRKAAKGKKTIRSRASPLSAKYYRHRTVIFPSALQGYSGLIRGCESPLSKRKF